MFAKLPNGAGCKAEDIKYIQVRTDTRNVKGQPAEVSQVLIKLDGEESALVVGAYESRNEAENIANNCLEAANSAGDEATLSSVGSGAAVKAGAVKALRIKGERSGQGAMYSVLCTIESEQPFTIDTFPDPESATALSDKVAGQIGEVAEEAGESRLVALANGGHVKPNEVRYLRLRREGEHFTLLVKVDGEDGLLVVDQYKKGKRALKAMHKFCDAMNAAADAEGEDALTKLPGALCFKPGDFKYITVKQGSGGAGQATVFSVEVKIEGEDSLVPIDVFGQREIAIQAANATVDCFLAATSDDDSD